MNFKRPLILASSSPRRQYLMREAGFQFSVQVPNIDESFPADMPVEQVPLYLAKKKAEIFKTQLKDEIVITSDTVVILNDSILNKPADYNEAVSMLSRLSGQTHSVITAVCLMSKDKTDCFEDRTEVTFKKLSPSEIDYYIKNYKPFDKAGAYGAQDWIGLTAITSIRGSYFTVMGMPMHLVYERLLAF